MEYGCLAVNDRMAFKVLILLLLPVRQAAGSRRKELPHESRMGRIASLRKVLENAYFILDTWLEACVEIFSKTNVIGAFADRI